MIQDLMTALLSTIHYLRSAAVAQFGISGELTEVVITTGTGGEVAQDRNKQELT